MRSWRLAENPFRRPCQSCRHLCTRSSFAACYPLEEESIIGPDLTIEGQAITIRCKGRLRVNGYVRAQLDCVELLVGQGAAIDGSVTAKKVIVCGRVSGAVFGDGVFLHSTAHVEGDIQSRTLSIAQGAGFNGRSRIVTDTPPIESSPEVVPPIGASAAHDTTA